MLLLEVNGAVRPLYASLGFKGLILYYVYKHIVMLPFLNNKLVSFLKVKQARYRPGVAQSVPGS